MCNTTANNVLIESGWHYLACPRCSKKVLDDDALCIFRSLRTFKNFIPLTNTSVYGYFFHNMFMLRFEVEEHIGTTIFVALDSEAQKLVRQTAAELIGYS
ncbi:hypothetical protein MKX01_021051, partial [Papaver californicum]